MQVKKFEAGSMKEALVLIKNQLGPEAIILSAKENKKGYGIAGESSVEVTAAVSDFVLQKKKLAEKKLNEEHRTKFSSLPARRQKEYIDKVVDNLRKSSQAPTDITKRQYIDIEDDEATINDVIQEYSGIGSSVERVQALAKEKSEVRVRSAVQSAAAAGKAFIEPSQNVTQSQRAIVRAKDSDDNDTIRNLQNEIKTLKALLSKFQNVPQSFVSMHPGANYGLAYELSFMFEKLTGLGVDEEHTAKILKDAQEELSPSQIKKKPYVNAWVAKYLMDQLTIADTETLARFHVFAGPLGQGKTASLVKYASHLVIREKRRVAIVTCDSQKVGASEQLRIFSQILNIPFCVVRKQEDWERVQTHLAEADHILIDYPGMSLKSSNEVELFRSLLPPTGGGRAVHLVQSVLAKDIDAKEIVSRYLGVGVNDLIFTGLDETVQHGIIYNVQQQSGLPLHSFGIGPQIPEDYEPATKERVIDLLFKLTKVKQEKGYL